MAGGAFAMTMGIWPALALALFASWRLTHLLANEDGPGTVILRLRVWLGESWAGALLDCFQCVSLWVSAPLALALTSDPVEWVLAWLGLSGAACVLERVSQQQSPAAFGNEDGDRDHGMLWTGTSGAQEPTYGNESHGDPR